MLSKKCIDNLTKLRDWVEENKELIKDHFCMRTFIQGPCVRFPYQFLIDAEDIFTQDCDTSCCLLGWASASGIFWDQVDRAEFSSSSDWGEFGRQVFGQAFCEDEHLWSYLFAQHWPNDVDHAIRRIDTVIELNGVLTEYDVRK